MNPLLHVVRFHLAYLPLLSNNRGAEGPDDTPATGSARGDLLRLDASTVWETLMAGTTSGDYHGR